MFSLIRKNKREVRDRTVYLEIFGDNKVIYRVIAGRMFSFGEDVVTYGVEAEDKISGKSEKIPDFSRDIEDAVDFADTLITCRTPPRELYNKALGYLCMSI